MDAISDSCIWPDQYTWSLNFEKNNFFCIQPQKVQKKEVIFKFRTIFRTGKKILIVFTVHVLWPVSIFILMTDTTKNDKLRNNLHGFQVEFLSYVYQIYFCVFYLLNIAQEFQLDANILQYMCNSRLSAIQFNDLNLTLLSKKETDKF